MSLDTIVSLLFFMNKLKREVQVDCSFIFPSKLKLEEKIMC